MSDTKPPKKMKVVFSLSGKCNPDGRVIEFEGSIVEIISETIHYLVRSNISEGHGFDEMNLKFIKEDKL